MQHDLNLSIEQFIQPVHTLLRDDQTVEQVMSNLRGHPISGAIIYFYVIDAQSKLKGIVSTRKLLMSAPSTMISTLLESHLVTLPKMATIEDACALFIQHRFLALPVVDEMGGFLGTVAISDFAGDLFDSAEKHSYESSFQLIGVHLAQARQMSSWASFRDRFPWLLCNISGGILCAFLSGLYEEFLDHMIVIALFIPVVLALAESVSIQSMSITLQSIHVRKLSRKFFFQSIVKELLTAVYLGMASGFLVGVVEWIWKKNLMVCIAIGISIFCSVITACLLGVAFPYAVYLLKKDPKVSAGPITLAAADLLALIFYFNLSGWLLNR